MPGSMPRSPAAQDDSVPSPVTVSGPAHLLRVTLLMAGSCLPILGAVLIAPVLPKMQDHFASVPGAKALVPLALTVPALSPTLLAPFAGVIVDRLGRKRLLIVATLLYAVFGTAPLWLESLGAIIASRALVGVTEAAIMTCCTTLIGDYYSGRLRVKYLALQTMCASASATVYAARGTWVRPGDVLGSGTCGNGGCLAELWGLRGERDPAPLKPGDTVTLTVEGIGSVSNTVVSGADPVPVRPARRRARPGRRAAAPPHRRCQSGGPDRRGATPGRRGPAYRRGRSPPAREPA
ncbi:MFS transporter [Streptomyces sp. NPDC005303]|uniref:MFS transporter n=1 Tax=Streptomyces sp. NPDC005303 TaxID=3155713 RepID=UPI0033B57A8E